jgi:transcriptional antiterminator Rof (Rho-off)
VTPQIYESEPLRVEDGESVQASASDHIYRAKFGGLKTDNVAENYL